jgi:acetoin utilization deacetylase AcuC-like enzyme
MPIVWSDRCRLHEPEAEIWVGMRTPATEVPARTEAILETLRGAGASPIEAEPHADDALLAVHDRALVDYLASAWEEWEGAGLPLDPGQERVVPYVFAHTALTNSPAVPAAPWAKPGYFAYDTMTLIGPGTWEAARGSVDAALTAVDLVLEGALGAYACTRPPGHHACRRCFGGSCYLNSAAVAAAELVGRLGGRVAVVDIDAHHGNGTQEIFYERGDVLVGSVHIDPAEGWFPHFLGFEDERGAGQGGGANLNRTMAPFSGNEAWLEGIGALTGWAREEGAQALVVPLGVDAAASDPESQLRVRPAGFRHAGRILGGLRLPTVFVQEGGYDRERLGRLVLETLLGFEEAL